MQFTHEYNLIKIFQESFSFPVLCYSPVNNKTITLRHNLIKEEAEETQEGIELYLQRIKENTLQDKDESLVEIADGLGDLSVVTLGGLYTFGLPVDLELGKKFSLQIETKVSFDNTTSTIVYLLDNYILKEYNDSVSLEDYHGALNLILLEIKRLWAIYLPNVSFKDIYEEIHDSNMSKACETEETALKTIAQPQYKDVNLSYTVTDGRYFVRRDDNKLIKSCDYKPANLTPIVYAA
jgi:hypothetical protein